MAKGRLWCVAILSMVLCVCSGQSYRPIVTANTTYYVRTDGNDTACTGLTDAAYGSGSYPQNCAFLTWQGAINIVETYDFNNHSVTVEAGNEGSAKTFNAGMVISGLIGGGNLYLEPSASGTTIIGSNGGGGAISLQQSPSVQVWVGGLTLEATGGGYGTIEVSSSSSLFFDRPTGPTFGSTGRVADIWLHDNLSMVQITNTSFGISGNQNAFIEVTDNAHAFIESNTITLSGTPNWGAAFAVILASASLQYVGNSYVGTATGLKYYIVLNGVLNTEGGGASHLPGSVSGATGSGGVVDTP